MASIRINDAHSVRLETYQWDLPTFVLVFISVSELSTVCLKWLNPGNQWLVQSMILIILLVSQTFALSINKKTIRSHSSNDINIIPVAQVIGYPNSVPHWIMCWRSDWKSLGYIGSANLNTYVPLSS